MVETIRPSVKSVEINCGKCRLRGTVFFTNKEIRDDTMIEQFCSRCKEITKWWTKNPPQAVREE